MTTAPTSQMIWFIFSFSVQGISNSSAERQTPISRVADSSLPMAARVVPALLESHDSHRFSSRNRPRVL